MTKANFFIINYNSIQLEKDMTITVKSNEEVIVNDNCFFVKYSDFINNDNCIIKSASTLEPSKTKYTRYK